MIDDNRLKRKGLRCGCGSESTLDLAKLHRQGLGIEKSNGIAAKYLQANADSGHALSLIAMAEVQEKSNPAEAISITSPCCTPAEKEPSRN